MRPIRRPEAPPSLSRLLIGVNSGYWTESGGEASQPMRQREGRAELLAASSSGRFPAARALFSFPSPRLRRFLPQFGGFSEVKRPSGGLWEGLWRGAWASVGRLPFSRYRARAAWGEPFPPPRRSSAAAARPGASLAPPFVPWPSPLLGAGARGASRGSASVTPGRKERPTSNRVGSAQHPFPEMGWRLKAGGGLVALPLPPMVSMNRQNGPSRSRPSLVSFGCERRFGACAEMGPFSNYCPSPQRSIFLQVVVMYPFSWGLRKSLWTESVQVAPRMLSGQWLCEFQVLGTEIP